jgi:hypothetical protein
MLEGNEDNHRFRNVSAYKACNSDVFVDISDTMGINLLRITVLV